MAKCEIECSICQSRNTYCYVEIDDSNGDGPHDKYTILCKDCGHDEFELIKTSGLGTICPYCGKMDHIASKPKEFRHQCNSCGNTFSVLVGTIFENTKRFLFDIYFPFT